MKLLTQPNRWSCLPTAVAMAIGVELKYVLDKVGHDGSAIQWPGLPEPQCRRSFHIQEMYDLIINRGFMVTPFEVEIILANQPEQAFRNLGIALVSKMFDIEHIRHLYACLQSRLLPIDHLPLVIEWMGRCSGVLLGLGSKGTPHAVAWNADEEMIYDPCGEIVPLTTKNFQIGTFILITRC